MVTLTKTGLNEVLKNVYICKTQLIFGYIRWELPSKDIKNKLKQSLGCECVEQFVCAWENVLSRRNEQNNSEKISS